MYKIPVAIITIWHPEKFAMTTSQGLSSMPSLKKNRNEQESYKAKIANTKGMEITSTLMHERHILNFGKSISSFRQTWLDGIDLSGIIEDYSLRLIDTTEQPGSQARFRLEARPNWGDEPNILPIETVRQIKENLSQSKLSVRQLWKNPFTIDTKKTPKGPFYEQGQTINLVLGPYVKEECLRKAAISFRRHLEKLAIHQHCPFYRTSLTTDDIHILPECILWWAEYE